MAKKTSKATAPASAQRYKPHPMFSREKQMETRMEAATGKPLAHWIGIAKKSGETKQRACAEWLAKRHPLSTHQAWWVASYAVSDQDVQSYENPVTLVDALYSGANAAKRDTHEAVVDVANALGDDVIVTSCKTMVPIYRKHVFAELKPVDGGVTAELAIGESVPAKGRLQKADGRMPGDRLTHRVLLRSPKDVDAEFKGWIAKAYEHGSGKMARAKSADTPPDLAKALKANAKATKTWGECTDAMRRDFILWIASAKQEETRTRRVATSITNLAAGKKRNY